MNPFMKLVLEDGTEMIGKAGGYFLQSGEDRIAELVFNTSITGYPEVATDPSYADQMILFTAPHLGNYGFHRGMDESLKVHAKAILCKDLNCSHDTRSVQEWSQFLYEQKVPLIYDLDTRSLVLKIRESGALKAWVGSIDVSVEQALSRLKSHAELKHPILEVSTQATIQFPGIGKRIVLVDYGYKKSIVKHLLQRGCEVIVAPAQSSVETLLSYRPHGVMLSNGPGDPAKATWAIEVIRELQERVPLFGICMGHQLFALANGAKTTKLKFGHRGGNHPVRDRMSGKVLMTAQNHGYAVIPESIDPERLEWTFQNLNDESVEGLRHKTLPAFSVQFHPEAAAGPWDSGYLFDEFLEQVKQHGRRN